MRNTLLIAALFTGTFSVPVLSKAADLVFDDTSFIFQKTNEPRLGSIQHIYASEKESNHKCKVYLAQKTDSTVDGVLSVDKAIMKPPLTIAPMEIVEKPSQKYSDDVASVILVRNNQDSSKFVVILHRVTLVSERIVRDLRIECSAFKYEGFFAKSTDEFQRLKADWLGKLFELDPEVVRAN